jgi:hypothetical protein
MVLCDNESTIESYHGADFERSLPNAELGYYCLNFQRVLLSVRIHFPAKVEYHAISLT